MAYPSLRLAIALATLNVMLMMGVAQAKVYNKGNPADVSTLTQPTLCLAGGASDDLWVEGWRQLLTSSGGGDIVIIRPSPGRGTYDSWIYNDTAQHGLPEVDSVTTITLTKRHDAQSHAAVTAVNGAELVFFDGGDQSLYLNLLEGTPLETALDEALHVRRIPMGGTSAGMAILAGIDFTSKYSPSDTAYLVTSEWAMKDPTAQFVDLDRATLVPPFLANVITDTHFTERNRQGRLVGFMARAVYNSAGKLDPLNIKAIGADEGTAFCYDMTTGVGKVYGTNSVHFAIGIADIERITPGDSLHWFADGQAVKVYSIHSSQSATAHFDLSTWSGVGGSTKYWSVDGSESAAPKFLESSVSTKTLHALDPIPRPR